LIGERLKARQRVTELEVQELIVQHSTRAGWVRHPPIVAFGSHASDGITRPARGPIEHWRQASVC